MKPRVYLETTVISYLAGRPSRDLIIAGRQAITIEWWAACRDRFDVCVSALVVTEAEDGDSDAAKQRLDVIRGVPALDINDEALSLARILIETGPMPAQYPEDALHIAICAVNGIDYLVTWNCKHLANAVLRRQVEGFLEKHGYVCPVICTPEELMEV